jgi:hypothetical protein
VGGQNGPKNMVDDGNLTAFIIRYRLMPTDVDFFDGINRDGIKMESCLLCPVSFLSNFVYLVI